MIINNIGINFAGGGGSTGGTAVLTADTFTENRRYTPPTGVDGYSAVTVNVDVVGPYNSGYTEGYASGFTSGETEGYASGYTSGETVGYASGTTDGAAAQKALLTSTAITENGSYTSENGFSAVTVDVQAGGENRLNSFFTNTITAVTQSDLSGVTGIRDYGFYGSSNLKTVDLPASVKTLYQHAFHASGIEMLDVSNVTTYGSSVFSGCTSLTGLTGFENYTGISQQSMFEGCTALTGDFRTNMTSNSYLDYNKVFQDCKSLRSVTWLKNQPEVTNNRASSNVYAGCTSMEYLDYTHNTVVPQLRFVNPFTAFTANYEIRVPEVLYDSWTAATNWSDSAIVGHIKAYPNPYPIVNLKYKVTGSTDMTFDGLSSGYLIVSSSFDSTTGYAEKNVYNLTEIPSNFRKNFPISYPDFNLKEIEFGEGVTKIADNALLACYGLSAITLPSTITELGMHCIGTSTQSMPNPSVITIKATTPPTINNSFQGVNSAGTLYVPNGSIIDYNNWIVGTVLSGWTVTAIPPYADCQITTTAASETVKIGYTYQSLADLADVLVDGVSVKSSLVDDTYTFADAGTHIVRYVYYSNTATTVTRQVDRLESYEASMAVEVIGQNALNMYQAANPSQLASISLPGVKIIDYQGITNTIATDIYAPKVTSIGNKALQFNPNLDPVSMPLSGITSIGNNAIRQSAIKEAHFGPALTTYDYNVFNECYSLSSLTFDSATSGLTTMPSVGDKTYALTEIVFPDCIHTYGQGSSSYAMMTNSSGLTSITFGTGTTLMDGLIFKGDMGSLTSIYCKATTAPTISSGCFGPVTANTGTLYVPAGSDYSTWAAELGSNWTVSYTL